MIITPATSRSTNSTQGEIFVGFDSVAEGISKRIAEGFFWRIESFPAREVLLGRQAGHMDSLPENILWAGLGEGSASIFVVYHLMHEGFSNPPQFFRWALIKFLRAQPDRFAGVFNRETIWSVMAAWPLMAASSETPSVDQIACCLAQLQRRGIWWRSDAACFHPARP